MMRYFNTQHEEIPPESVDLSKGQLIPYVTIKPDARPIDNVEKFAWAEEDYEQAWLFVLNPREESPSPMDIMESQIIYTAMMTDTLLEI